MKKNGFISKCAAALLCVTAMTATGCDPKTGGGDAKALNPADYETQEKFISIIDVPPSPRGDLSDYKALGFSGFILTEDTVNLTDPSTGVTISDGYKKAIENLTANGLDIYIRNQYNDPDYFDNDEVKQGSGFTGANYTIPIRHMTDEFKEYPAVKGFYMADEPKYDNITKYGKIIDWYNEHYSDTYFHMNLFPSYADPVKLLGGKTYPEYVQHYIDEIAAKVKGHKSICLDNYPFKDKGAIRPTFLSDLMITANKTKAYNDSVADGADKAYMGLCIQTFYDAGLLDITCAEDVSFQLCTGMAMGARMYEYFLYGSGAGMHEIFDASKNKRGNVYDYVKEANSKYLGFEKIVNAFEWQGACVFAAEKEKDVENDSAFYTVRDLQIKDAGALDREKTSSRLDAVVGCFRKGDTDGYMVVNYTLPSGGKAANVVNLAFKDCSRALVYKTGDDGVKAEEVKITDGELRVSLACGDGAFVIPVK